MILRVVIIHGVFRNIFVRHMFSVIACIRYMNLRASTTCPFFSQPTGSCFLSYNVVSTDLVLKFNCVSYKRLHTHFSSFLELTSTKVKYKVNYTSQQHLVKNGPVNAEPATSEVNIITSDHANKPLFGY